MLTKFQKYSHVTRILNFVIIIYLFFTETKVSFVSDSAKSYTAIHWGMLVVHC